MDGVLVDGEPLHFQAVNQLLAEEGKHITLDEYRPYMGTKSGWQELIRHFGLAHAADYYAPRYNELILHQYRQHSFALPGAGEIVRGLRAAGVPVAVASSSIHPWVEACLAKIGLADAFDAVVTGSDVAEGKPDPAIYLLAARRLGVQPALCLAIEDAPAGILAAKNAGMTCWAVRTPYTIDLALPNPARVFQDLTEIPLDRLLEAAA